MFDQLLFKSAYKDKKFFRQSEILRHFFICFSQGDFYRDLRRTLNSGKSCTTFAQKLYNFSLKVVQLFSPLTRQCSEAYTTMSQIQSIKATVFPYLYGNQKA